MAVEIEVKIRVEGFEEYAERLSRLGGQRLGDYSQVDRFFDREDRILLEGDCGLRIREETTDHGGRTRMCFKGARQAGAFKQRQEIEFTVDDGEAAKEFLKALGFEPMLMVKKQRQLWRLEGCDVCLDEVEGLGRFVEIEGASEETIRKVQGLLGLEAGEVVAATYAMMIRQKQIQM